MRRKKRKSLIPWNQRVFHDLDKRDAERDEEYSGSDGSVRINFTRILRWFKKKKLDD